MSKKKNKFRVPLIVFALFFLILLFGLLAGSSLVRAPADSDSNISENSSSTSAPEDDNNLLERPSAQFSFVVGGDMMFDRGVDYKYRGDKIYDAVVGLREVFQGYDLSIVNLEGPISAVPIPADSGRSMIFNFPPIVPDVLTSLGIQAVSLANNHTHNAGVSGFQNTLNVLTSKNIVPIGDETTVDTSSVKKFSSEDGKMAVIAINCLESSTDITSMIKYEKSEGYYVLIFPHWGVEYAKVHTKSQQNLAQSWIDAGADIVIGSHPHVVQDAERYKNKPIIYSLGNLLFDQTFSDETQRGLVVAGDFEASSLELKLIPIVSKNIKPAPEVGAKKEEIMNSLIQYLGGNLEFSAN